MNRQSFIASLLGIAGLASKKADFNVSSEWRIKPFEEVAAYKGNIDLSHDRIEPFNHDPSFAIAKVTRAQRLSLKKRKGLMVIQTDGDKGAYVVGSSFNELIWAKLTYA